MVEGMDDSRVRLGGGIVSNGRVEMLDKRRVCNDRVLVLK